MKIISFNISIAIDNARAVAEYLKKQDADIVCLQEVMRPLESGVLPMYRSSETIVESLKKIYPYYFFAPEWVADMFYEPAGKPNRIFGGMAEQGKLILSKYPITHGYNYFYNKNYEFDRERRDFYQGNDHGRALQIANIDIAGKIIQIANIHGTYTKDKKDTERTMKQSEFVLEKMKINKLPAIILGDFNLLPDTRSIALVNNEYKNLIDIFKIKQTRSDKDSEFTSKRNVIDYVFADHAFDLKNLKIEENQISDHYPLIAELELK
jgi:endonuclease/exonuclease/phosphatase family metal-dependent hydrolase